MRTRLQLFSVLGLCVTTIVMASAQQPKSAPPPQTKAAAPAAAGDIAVVVNYTGKGTVDAAHELLVFMFNTPNISANAEPIGMQVATKNGETVIFKGVSTNPVYFVAVYDETGGYHGRSGPPTAGLPYTIYAKDAKSPATAVAPGGKAPIKISFSDARRWGK
jgi:hypothetical protein